VIEINFFIQDKYARFDVDQFRYSYAE